MYKPYLGRGWSFPPTFHQEGARVDMLEEEADVASSLEILLGTLPGERILQPHYGCNLRDAVFESLDTRLKTLMADLVESAILYHEPRIELQAVDMDDSRQAEGIIQIHITYRVKSTNSRFNFVYPFYINEGTDINLTTAVRLLPESGDA